LVAITLRILLTTVGNQRFNDAKSSHNKVTKCPKKKSDKMVKQHTMGTNLRKQYGTKILL